MGGNEMIDMYIKNILLIIVFCLFFSCVEVKREVVANRNEKRIEYFYTDFDANHGDVDLFSLDLQDRFKPLVADHGQTTIDSAALDELYSKLMHLDQREVKRDKVYYLFYQFKIFENDSLKAVVVLDNDNYFSANGTDFVKNDTLAFQLKKIMGVYEKCPLDKRHEVFQESRLFNLDTIPEKISDDGNMLYYRGRLVANVGK